MNLERKVFDMVLLKLDAVSYQSDQRIILDQISLIVEQGAFLTISGPSGGGKSTLLRLIASLLTPTSGEIFFRESLSNNMTIPNTVNRSPIVFSNLPYLVKLYWTI